MKKTYKIKRKSKHKRKQDKLAAGLKNEIEDNQLSIPG